jgi:soluble lytic murein transglycosylase
MTSQCARLAAAILLVWAGGACAQSADAAEALRAEFRAALDGAAQLRPRPDSAALRGYLLYPYVEAARLRAGLGRAPAGRRDFPLEARVQRFLERSGEEPAARELRRAWLAYLGERRIWPAFQAAAPAVPGDIALRCHALHARLGAADTGGVREDVVALWLGHRERPAACEPVFQWLEAPGRLTDAEIEGRARYAARNRLRLPAAVAGLPPARRELVQFWERLRTQPERELKAFAASPPPAAPRPGDAGLAEALVSAFDGVARRDSRLAGELFGDLEEHALFTEAQRHELGLAYALGLAYDLDAKAIDAFRDLPDEALDPLGREWRVRAALFHGEPRRALEWIEAMPPAQRDEPRWRYFRARLLHKLNPKLSRELFTQVAGEREYYGFLAAERLGQRPELRPRPLQDDLAVQAELAALPAMRRARELFHCERRDLAASELRFALGDRGAAQRAQAARLVASWGWYASSVRLLSDLQLWDDLWLRFPRPYDIEIEQAAKDTGLPADWLYAVVRTESLYDPRAVSPAGALGLLQLMLPTARSVAQRAGLPVPARDDLLRPEVNIALGARYLREMQKSFRNNFVLTLAAYNAGPNRVPEWLPREPLDAEVWIENIPYNETRAYVQRALSNLVIGGWRRSGEPTAVRPLLATVPAAQEKS